MSLISKIILNLDVNFYACYKHFLYAITNIKTCQKASLLMTFFVYLFNYKSVEHVFLLPFIQNIWNTSFVPLELKVFWSQLSFKRILIWYCTLSNITWSHGMCLNWFLNGIFDCGNYLFQPQNIQALHFRWECFLHDPENNGTNKEISTIIMETTIFYLKWDTKNFLTWKNNI